LNEAASKILFYLSRDADGYPPVEVESMWAIQRNDGYELDNIPFYAKGVALGDVVEVDPDADGALVYRNVVRRGGHSTYRVLLLAPAPDDPGKTVNDLRAIGFEVEYDLPQLLAIDIPPTISLEEVENALLEGVDQGRWELEEGYRAGDP
jgi:hypothetical protein